MLRHDGGASAALHQPGVQLCPTSRLLRLSSRQLRIRGGEDAEGGERNCQLQERSQIECRNKGIANDQKPEESLEHDQLLPDLQPQPQHRRKLLQLAQEGQPDEDVWERIRSAQQVKSENGDHPQRRAQED